MKCFHGDQRKGRVIGVISAEMMVETAADMIVLDTKYESTSSLLIRIFIT